ncbi:MAG: S-layer homology domain-containing protein, partial [Solobacterium sp.]|nr:S-layer homology domain-containing protein [Solobacterium sp.]
MKWFKNCITNLTLVSMLFSVVSLTPVQAEEELPEAKPEAVEIIEEETAEEEVIVEEAEEEAPAQEAEEEAEIVEIEAEPEVSEPAEEPEEETVEAEEEETEPVEISLYEVTDMGATVYGYTAPVLNNPTPMMTPVFFVWNDGGYATIEEADAKLNESGLLEWADENMGCVVLLTPANGSSWTEEDVTVYKNITSELTKATNQFKFVTYNNLFYAIGEGKGATFVNNVMSQNANRIGAALIIGGEIGSPADTMSLPAYLVDARDKAVSFYKTINKTDTEDTINGNPAYINSALTTEKVIVSNLSASELNPEVLDDAWNSLIRKITRNVMGRCVWAETYNMASGGSTDPITEVFTLMDRVMPEEADLTFKGHIVDTDIYPGSWNEWIPNEALAEGNTEKYPLVMVFHGNGDHPYFEAESNGWLEIARDERIIVVSVEWQILEGTDRVTTAYNKQLIEHIIETLPVDESKIYCTGFSAGAGQTFSNAGSFGEMFAGIAPLGMGGNLTLSTDYDLAVFLGAGTFDMYATTPLDRNGDQKIRSYSSAYYRAINQSLALNEIDYQLDTASFDFETYPFFGYDKSLNSTEYAYTSKHGWDISTQSYANAQGIDLVRLMQVWGSEHNHYTEYAHNIWDFWKDFSRDTETKELVYQGQKVREFKDGVYEVADMGAKVYGYTAPVLNNPTPMMTPVFFVFNEAGYANIDEAVAKLDESGLRAWADANKGAVVLLSPANGSTWTEEDVAVYKNITAELTLMTNQFSFVTYNNLFYMIGEGAGATFVNNIMSQNANRIGAALVIGGEIDNPADAMSLPAYLVNARDKAVNFYKTINKTDTTDTLNGNTAYINSAFTTEKVVVSKLSGEELTPEILDDAWNTLIRRITRNVMGRCVWAETYNMPSGGSTAPITEVFTLMDRVMPEEAGLVFNEHLVDLDLFPGSWDEFIPEEALAADNTEEFPLMMVYHGSGDHPYFEAESNGWLEIARDERIIVVSVEYQILETAGRVTPAQQRALVEHIIDKFPVDKSRVYCTGFSMGGAQSFTNANNFGDLLAGIAPLGASGNLTLADAEWDMPIFMGTGSVDMYNTTAVSSEDPTVTKYSNGYYNAINKALRLNEIDYQIDTAALDYEAYPFFGYDSTLNASVNEYTSKAGIDISVEGYANEKGIDMVRLMQVWGMEHNHYTEFAPNIWDFLKHFSRDPESLEVYYDGEPVNDDYNGVYEITDMGAKIFGYTAPELYNPTPMMTSVLFVWPDEVITSRPAAYNFIAANGLKDIADEYKGAVIVMAPVDGTAFGEADVQTYLNVLAALPRGGQFGFSSYDNLIFGVAEGKGATFFNNYMTQNAHRMGAAAIFGGSMGNPEKLMSLPAYLVDPKAKTADFYKAINKVDTEEKGEGKQIFINSALTTEKVMIADSDAGLINEADMKDAWESLMKRITRNVMGRCVWAEAYNMASGGSRDPITEVFTLMDRLDYDEEGLVFNEHVADAAVYPGYWNEWIPEEALESGTKVPMVVNFHGSGDHPTFEAESNGWIQIAADERIIVVSVEWQIRQFEGSSNAQAAQTLINHLIETLPVDPGKVYATGFSAGTGQTLNLASLDPTLLAGIAPLAVPTNNSKFSIDPATYGDFDLPVFFGTGSVDMYAAAGGILNPARVDGVVNPALAMNETGIQIDTANIDYDAYPFYGFDCTEYTESYTSAHGFDIHITSYPNAAGIDMVQMMIVDGMEHNHYTEFAKNIWPFFKDFSRDTETGEILYKGEPVVEDDRFVDVRDESKYYYNAVYWARDLGITKGYAEDNTFRPEEGCTRAQM